MEGHNDEPNNQRGYSKWTTEMLSVAKRMAESGAGASEIQNAVGMSLRSVQKYLADTHPLTEGGERREYSPQKRGRKQKNDDQLRSAIARHLSEHGSATLRSVSETLPAELPHSPSTISRTLHSMGWSRKRTQLIPAERNSQQTTQDRRRYALRLSTISDEDLVFVDETGFNLHTTPQYAWSPLGITPSITVPGNRGTNISVVSVITVSGLCAFEIVDGAFDAQRIRSFFIEKLFPQLTPTSIIVMDNARIHHSAVVTQLFSTTSYQLVFLPPYSPQLNPIEEAFSMIKNRYRAISPAPRNRTAIKEVLVQLLTGLSTYDFIPFYRHMRTFVNMAFNAIPFT